MAPNNFMKESLKAGDGTNADADVRARESKADELDVAEVAAEYYKAIIDSSDDAIVGKTLDGTVTSWNRGAQAIFGYSAMEMLGRSLLVIFPADRLDEEDYFIERLQRGEKIDHYETVRIHKDGRQVNVSVTISPIRDRVGRIIGASKVARDITPLKVERERLQLALDAASNGLWDWDLRTGYVHRSPHYYQAAGFEPGEDTHDFEFFKRTIDPRDVDNALQCMNNYRSGLSDRIEFEYRLVDKQGPTNRWMMARGKAVERDQEGKPLRIVGTVTDISDTKRKDETLRKREAQLSRVIEGSDQGYWDWNVQTDRLDVSPRWETMLGYTPGEMNTSVSSYANHIHPDDLTGALAKIRDHMAGLADCLEYEIRCRTQTGGWRWILTRGRVVEWDAEGKPLMMAGTHTDITQRKQFELSIKEAVTVFESSYEGIMIVNTDSVITRVNPAFTRITGFSADEAIGQSTKIMASSRQVPGYYRDIWASLQTQGFWRGEMWNRRKNGELFAQLLSASTVRDDAGEVQHYVAVFSDISQLKAHEAELDRVAHFDPLTGTPNRRLLADRMEQSIARTNRSDKSLAVCYLDLDGFKAINDQYGHAFGDQLLVGVSNNLRHVLRSEDTLARLGGDEFVLLLSDISSPEECSLILARVVNAIRTPLAIDGHEISVSASIGVSLYPQDHSDADTLLRHADQAMYLAKESGKNRFHLFDPDSDRKAQFHRQFVERLHIALDSGEFVLHYQPKVDLLTGQVIGAEALIRWQHPEQGLLSPAAFLSHVEGSSVDHPLGIWVIDTALQQAAVWIAQGHPIKVSVNIGGNHLLRPSFLQDLKLSLARQPSVATQWLELEVLESAAITDMGQAVTVLSQCKELGLSLALDDFGTGYSSLAYLRTLPIDTLKIDQSFVRDMLTDAEDFGIVECVVRLASAFKRDVIAEGVETLEHGQALLKLGCRLAQGYGIARPMPPDQLLPWCEDWTARAAWLACHDEG